MEKRSKSIREWSDYYFNQMYEYARKYSDYYGSLDVNINFITNDGINYDKEGKIKLGRWVHKQLEMVNPDSPRGILLSKIGMIWNFNDNGKRIHDLCRMYIIDTEVNFLLLNRLSFQEFEAKINYCLDNNIPIMNNYRELNDVFYLPNELLKEKYNITKEEIFDSYYNIEQNKSLKKTIY